MPGPAPKHHSARARANKHSTRATLFRGRSKLSELMDLKVPELKAELRDQGLKVGGTKLEMARRLAYKDLPQIPQNWHPRAVEFWDDMWASPMSPEWDESDIHNAYVLALLYNDIWQATSPTGRSLAMSEFRLQRQSLGLDPLSRRRLEWTIEQAGEAKDKGDKRRSETKPAPPSQPHTDPAKDRRNILTLAK